MTNLRRRFDHDFSINRTMKIELNFLKITLLTVLKNFYFNKVSCNDIDLSIINYDKFRHIEQKNQTQTFILKYPSVKSKLNFIVIEVIDDQITIQILFFVIMIFSMCLIKRSLKSCSSMSRIIMLSILKKACFLSNRFIIYLCSN